MAVSAPTIRCRSPRREEPDPSKRPRSSFGGVLTYATGHGQRLSVRGAIDHRKSPGDVTQNKPAGGAAGAVGGSDA